MASFNDPIEGLDDLAHSDTFLSRVFGLHSVYNQLPENYQYYDPESELYDIRLGEVLEQRAFPTSGENFAESGAQLGSASGIQDRSADSQKLPDKNLLDSESDLDLSSLASLLPPSPLLRPLGAPPPNLHANSPQISWDAEISRQGPNASSFLHKNGHVPMTAGLGARDGKLDVRSSQTQKECTEGSWPSASNPAPIQESGNSG